VSAEAVDAHDEAGFRQLAKRHERELHLHCYRMLGSLDEADDALQETLLRAWRFRGGFEGRSSLRAWLYRIATNVCLTIETGRRARAIPDSWDEMIQSPYPDRLLDELPDDVASPDARFDLRESVRLAFLTAIQHLSPRQRAVLILRDVLGFSAAEVAACLDTTRASVTSALQRARAALAERPPAPAAPSSVEEELVRRFVAAWDAVDVDGLVALLAEDVVMAMPPFPEIHRGRRALHEFFSTVPAGGHLDEIRLVETRANRQPALAAYYRDPEDGALRSYGVMVLDFDGAAIASIAGFAFAELMPVFGLPAALPPRS